MDYLIYNKETDELVDVIQLKDEQEKQNYEDLNTEVYLKEPDSIQEIDFFQTGTREDALYD